MVQQFARFDLGKSFFYPKDVWELIKEKLPVSISLGLWTFFLSYSISVPLGVAKAVRSGSRFDTVTSLIVLAGYAIPGFVLGVVLLVVFAIAVMDGVTTTFWANPTAILRLVAAACVAAVLLHGAGWVLLAHAGASSAWSSALLSGNRNMGLMLAVTAGTAGEAFSLYVGVAQLPMYFAPLLLGPLVRRSRRPGRG